MLCNCIQQLQTINNFLTVHVSSSLVLNSILIRFFLNHTIFGSFLKLQMYTLPYSQEYFTGVWHFISLSVMKPYSMGKVQIKSIDLKIIHSSHPCVLLIYYESGNVYVSEQVKQTWVCIIYYDTLYVSLHSLLSQNSI